MSAGTSTVPAIRIEGAPVDVLDQLMEVRVVGEIGMASRADLRLDVTRADDLISTFGPGKIVEVSVSIDGADTAVFTGEIISVGFDRRRDRDAVTVQAWDKAHRLGRTVIHRVFTNQSRSDILSSLVGDVGLQFNCDSTVLNETLPYYQVASTPRRLLDEFCNREGCEWINLGGTVTVRRRTSSVLATYTSDDLRSVELRASGVDQASEVTILGWDPDQQQVVSGTARTTSEHQNSSSMVSDITSNSEGRSPTVTLPSTCRTATDATAAAEGLLHRLDSTVARGRGEVEVDPRLTPGGQVTLEDITDQWSGTYHVTVVEHVFGGERAFISRFHFGPLPSPSARSAAEGTAPTIGQHALIAKVTETGFGPGDTEPMVKVKFPTLSNDLQSEWLRVLSVGAGPDRGFVMPYDVDDEVVVAFLGPELSSGVVIGGLHSQASAPPEGLQVVNSRHGVIVLKSTTNTFQMVDDGVSDPTPGFHATTPTTTIDIDDEKVSIVTTNLPVTLKNDSASIEFDANGNITIEGQQVTIKGANGVTIESSGGDVAAKGMNVNLEAQTNLKGKGNAGVTIESPAVTAVKGSLVQLN